jgi:hypothetical protein
LEKNNSDNSGNWIRFLTHSGLHPKQAMSPGETEGKPVTKQPHFSDMEVPLPGWMRSLCTSTEYPAFGDLESVELPDILTEQLSEFKGFACYETTFVLDSPKPLLLEISDTSGSVEVFMNGETAGMRIKPPYRYDLSSLAQQGKNYLAIEVAINLGKMGRVTPEQIQGKTEYDQHGKKTNIIRSIKLYTN